jgi:putative MATE family efflux protein
MMFGAYSGVGVFTAQFWGKRDLASVRKVLGIGLMIGLAGSLFFTVLALGLPRAVLGFYTEDPAVIAGGSGYLRIVGFSYTATAISFAYYSVLRSTGYVRVPMVVGIFALSLKTLLNYGLILGNFGLPALGIEGAAIATLIARLVEVTVILAVVYLRKLPPAARISELAGFSREFLGRVLKTSLPVLFNEMLWSLGTTTYNMVYGRIGTDAIAAVNIAASIEGLAFVLFFGISEATGIMIGNRIGAGEEEYAFTYARQSLVLATTGAVLVGLLILVASGPLLTLYNLSDAAIFNARSVLRVMGLVLWIRVTNLVVFIGVLRAGGDTRFCLVLDAGSVWLVGVPLALLGGLVIGLPVYQVYLLVMAEEAVKLGIGVWRFLSRRWITNLVQAA